MGRDLSTTVHDPGAYGQDFPHHALFYFIPNRES